MIHIIFCRAAVVLIAPAALQSATLWCQIFHLVEHNVEPKCLFSLFTAILKLSQYVMEMSSFQFLKWTKRQNSRIKQSKQ
jgi:hypothetical protein